MANRVAECWCVFIAACLAAACTSSSPERSADDSPGAPASVAPVDASRLLDVFTYVRADYLAAHGTCLPTDAEGRSRVVYALLPGDASYLRLAVAAPRGTIEMIDLVRGAPDGRIWIATLEPAGREVTARTFASNNDPTPRVETWPMDDPRARRLHYLANAALQSTCLGSAVPSQH
jgi:hypothetical protein